MSLFYQPLLDDSPTGLYLGGMAGATVLATVGPVGAMVGSAYAAKTTPLGPCPSHIRLFSSSADTKISTNIGTSIAWTTFTCECLFMPLVMSPCAVVSKTMYYASSTTQFPLSLWMQPDGRLQLHLDNGSDWVPNSMTDSAAGVMVRGQLHHVVVIIRASGQCEVYVNNVRVIDVTVAFNLSTSGVPFTFGGPAQNYAGGVGWQGAIGLFAAMAVYPTALSAARVEAHYNALLSSAYVKGTVKVAGAPTAGLKVRAYNRESGELAGECTTGAGAGASGNPMYDLSHLLLPFDTNLTDKSPYPLTVTPSGTAAWSAGWTRFGSGGSASFPGNVSSYLTVGTAAQCAWMTNTLESWTIRGWIKPGQVSSTQCLLSIGTNNSTMACILIGIAGTRQVWISWYKSSSYGGLGPGYPTNLATLNTPFYLEVVYDAVLRKIKLSVDGQFGTEATLNAASDYSTPTGYPIILGRYGDSNFPFTGNMDDLEILRGVVAHWADFTPPTAPPELFQETTDLPLGEYRIPTGSTDEVQVVALDPTDDPLENDKLFRVIPSTV